ncbi:peptidase S49 [Paraburkholderia steynii]|uniref:Peptidase S49 n=1 Tax=Paraburkholderia steynii TaxID=1245441 RepID=A0A4R0XGN2_9BURK|nr:peptidase S49 [Paraburkholderia steynii]
MNRSLLVSEFLSTPWAILPERLNAIAAVLARWDANVSASADVLASVRDDAEARDARRGEAARASNGSIAVLPFYGVSVQRTTMVEDISGSGLMSIARFQSAFRAVVADDSIGGVLIDVDSPGGSVYGVQELADEIYKARGQKLIVAVANSLSASAAYWIASSAGEFYVTPGGEAGSIGVFAAHENWAAALEKAGVEATLISAGKYKTEGNPYGPLSDDAKAFMQSRVDSYYGAFTRAVARNRRTDVATVRSGMGEGRVYGATDAKAANMVDDVATFDQVLSRMAKAIGQGKSSTRAQRNAALTRSIDILNA